MKKNMVIPAALVLVALVYYVSAGNVFYAHMLIMAAINTVLVSGLSLVARTGRLSFGHSAFAAISAYVCAILTTQYGVSWVLAALCGLAATTVVAYLLGSVIVKLRGVYFVLVTFAFAEFTRLALLEFPETTGGASGLAEIPPLGIGGFVIEGVDRWLVFSVLFCIVLTLLMSRFFKTTSGKEYLSVNDNPDLAESSGISVSSVQLASFVIGGAITGFGGILMSSYIEFVSPESFNLHLSITLVTMLVIGGVNSSWGPLIGALFLTPLPEILRGAQEYQHLFYGIVLVLILMIRPQGLVSIFSGLSSSVGALKKEKKSA
ncbi:branched-chain amino acid ABC transporter permease [Castellaniella sp.]|uniref:branched-chain amino acid ABC transporter permease n=1 Tax=Castellaniella sp. TaxID=1955812 RepID=UPI0035652207